MTKDGNYEQGRKKLGFRVRLWGLYTGAVSSQGLSQLLAVQQTHQGFVREEKST